MKANEAPEKLYVDVHDNLSDSILYGFTEKRKDNDIEYVRKDAFIEKVCEFLKSYRQDTPDGYGYIAGIVNDKTIEDFINYMKGE
jgi:hypothetical protein